MARQKNKQRDKPIDLKVQQGTHTRLLSVGQLLPADWQMVRIMRKQISEGEICLTVVRLQMAPAQPWKPTP